jgi:hypothetical protein
MSKSMSEARCKRTDHKLRRMEIVLFLENPMIAVLTMVVMTVGVLVVMEVAGGITSVRIASFTFRARC